MVIEQLNEVVEGEVAWTWNEGGNESVNKITTTTT